MKKLSILCIAAAMACLTLPVTAGTPEGKDLSEYQSA